MISKKVILEKFAEKSIPAVLIGGLAMRIYNSPRVTHDMDLAVKTLDVDKVMILMYEQGFLLVTSASDETVRLCTAMEEAVAWVNDQKPGALSFFYFPEPVSSAEVPISAVDISSEIDVLYDISIPFTRLFGNAQVIELDTLSVTVASPEDLLYLKERRGEKSASDYADIAFLKNLLK